MASNIEKTTARLKAEGIVAIVRGDYSEHEILQMGEALLEGGITLIEVTLNTRGALESIPMLRKRFGDTMMVGAGTVRTMEQVKTALDAGAEFLVSPNFDPPSVSQAMAHDVLHLPGVATPTEAQNALNAGCRMLKLFPVDVLGGAAYLKAIRAPLNDIDFVPTGGIGIENIAEYARAGAVGVGLGSSLVSKDWTPELLRQRGKTLRTAWDSVKDDR